MWCATARGATKERRQHKPQMRGVCLRCRRSFRCVRGRLRRPPVAQIRRPRSSSVPLLLRVKPSSPPPPFARQGHQQRTDAAGLPLSTRGRAPSQKPADLQFRTKPGSPYRPPAVSTATLKRTHSGGRRSRPCAWCLRHRLPECEPASLSASPDRCGNHRDAWRRLKGEPIGSRVGRAHPSIAQRFTTHRPSRTFHTRIARHASGILSSRAHCSPGLRTCRCWRSRRRARLVGQLRARSARSDRP